MSNDDYGSHPVDRHESAHPQGIPVSNQFPAIATDGATCPVHQLGHFYRGTARCAYCGHTHTARKAIMSTLAGNIRSVIGWEAADALVSQMITEERQEPADAPDAPKVYTFKSLTYGGTPGEYVEKTHEVRGPLYHGGGRTLRKGDTLRPGRKPNGWGDEGARSTYIHFTTNLATATEYARQTRGHVFEVEPTGEFAMGYGGDEYKSKHPLNVVRKLAPREWQ